MGVSTGLSASCQATRSWRGARTARVRSNLVARSCGARSIDQRGLTTCTPPPNRRCDRYRKHLRSRSDGDGRRREYAGRSLSGPFRPWPRCRPRSASRAVQRSPVRKARSHHARLSRCDGRGSLSSGSCFIQAAPSSCGAWTQNVATRRGAHQRRASLLRAAGTYGEVVDNMRAIAEAHKASGAQIALARLLAKPVVGSVINGASKVSELEDNLRDRIKLSEGALAALDEITASPGAGLTRA